MSQQKIEIIYNIFNKKFHSDKYAIIKRLTDFAAQTSVTRHVSDPCGATKKDRKGREGEEEGKKGEGEEETDMQRDGLWVRVYRMYN